ncbi:MAG: triose-phosphate isomerase, partial [Candidatus Thorarchaeota archaeon]
MSKIKTPVVIINFKTYPQATGERAVKLAKTCESVSREFDVPIVVSPQIPDIYRVVQSVDIPVFSQHMDAGDPGRFT